MNQNEFIQNTLKVIETFSNRYLPYAETAEVTHIATEEDGKVRFTMENHYYLTAWIDATGEFHIETEYGDDVFVSCKENWWTESIIQFMRFGTPIL